MDFVVRGSFSDPQSAQSAYTELLNSGFKAENIAFRSRFRAQSNTPPSGYDPIGGARLSGRVFSTLPATGFNLVGNSSTLDVTLGDLPEILEKAAANEDGDDGTYQMPSLRIEGIIRVEDGDHIQYAKEILIKYGATKVESQIRSKE